MNTRREIESVVTQFAQRIQKDPAPTLEELSTLAHLTEALAGLIAARLESARAHGRIPQETNT